MESALNLYLNEARAAARVLENEPAVLASARSGDVAAQHTLVQVYLYSAAEIALRLAPEGMGKLDAIQEANTVLARLVSQAAEPSIADHLEPAIEQHFGKHTTYAV